MGLQSNGEPQASPPPPSPLPLPPSSAAFRPSLPFSLSDAFLRLLVALLSVAGLLLMIKDRQIVPRDQGDGELLYLQAKFSYVTAFAYLVYSNGLVAIYSFFIAIALLLSSVGSSGSGKLGAWVVFILDQGLTYVLLGAAAASTEVAYLAKYGDEKVTWSKICNNFGHFCNLLRIALVVTFVSCFVMSILSVMSARHLFKKYAPSRR